MPDRAVTFLRQHGVYHAGETAAFPDATASGMVSVGLAEWAGGDLVMTDSAPVVLPALGADDGTLAVGSTSSEQLLPPADDTLKTSPGTGEVMTEVKPDADGVATLEGGGADGAHPAVTVGHTRHRQ